jgi:hypothetical protein
MSLLQILTALAVVFWGQLDVGTLPSITTNNFNDVRFLQRWRTPFDEPIPGLIVSLIAVNEEHRVLAINYADVVREPRIPKQTYVWNYESGEILYKLEKYVVEDSSSGQQYFIGEDFERRRFALIDPATGDIEFEVRASNVLTSNDDTLLAAWDSRGITIWNINDQQELGTVATIPGMAVAFCPDTSCFMVLETYDGGYVTIWDKSSGFKSNTRITYRETGVDGVFSSFIPFTSDGRYFTVRESFDTFVIELATGDTIASFPTAGRIPRETRILNLVPYLGNEDRTFIYSIAEDSTLGSVEDFDAMAFNYDYTLAIIQLEGEGTITYSIIGLIDNLPQYVLYEGVPNTPNILFDMFFTERSIIARCGFDYEVCIFGIQD